MDQFCGTVCVGSGVVAVAFLGLGWSNSTISTLIAFSPAAAAAFAGDAGGFTLNLRDRVVQSGFCTLHNPGEQSESIAHGRVRLFEQTLHGPHTMTPASLLVSAQPQLQGLIGSFTVRQEPVGQSPRSASLSQGPVAPQSASLMQLSNGVRVHFPNSHSSPAEASSRPFPHASGGQLQSAWQRPSQSASSVPSQSSPASIWLLPQEGTQVHCSGSPVA
jgi:hypothetical protein